MSFATRSKNTKGGYLYEKSSIEKVSKLREELEGVYEELAELRKEQDELQEALLREVTKKGDVYTPKKPELRAMEGFAAEVASELCCPHCLGPVTNYWKPGTKPRHCQFCGQALDWGEEAEG